MKTTIFNGQNGVATSANVNVVDFSKVEITDTMAENFAKEITENLSRIKSKGGCPLANFTINAKGGKVTQIREGVEKLSVTWYMLHPYCIENKKHRREIIIENGNVVAGSVRNLLVDVLNYMSYVQECFNDIKKYGVESNCVAIDFEVYPLLKSTYEKYGVAEMDRRFAEFSEYLASLDEVDSHFGDDYEGFGRVIDTIKSYLANYVPSYLDQFGDCVITIGWDNFNEDDMMMLIEDRYMYKSVGYALMVDGVPLRDILVYDDGVYVTVDYDKMFNKVA